MKRTTLLLASEVLAGFGLAGAFAWIQERPNILPVVTDDLDDGAGSIAYMGSLRSLIWRDAAPTAPNSE